MMPAPPDTSLPLAPVAPGERHELLDVLRGFALFGVLLSNLATTVFLGISREGLQALPTAAFETLADDAITLLVRYKFIFLFALLFGLGLAVQMDRPEQRGRPLGRVYLRRLGVLFVFGIAHMVLLWFGDILHMYALMGCLLFLVRHRGDGFLLALGAALVYGPMTALFCLPVIRELFGGAAAHPDPAAGAAWMTERVAAVTQGGYLAVIRDNLAIHARLLSPAREGAYCAFSLGVFLLGLVVGRRRYLQDASRHLDFFRRLLLWGLVIGVPLSVLMVLGRHVEPSSGWFLPLRLPVLVGVAALAGAYLAAVALLYQRPGPRRWLGWLAPVGRMALTNYLMHSVFYVLIFTGVGLGLAGRFGPLMTIPLAVGIFGFQMVFSRWWLARLRFGPMEWLWRTLTYGHRPP